MDSEQSLLGSGALESSTPCSLFELRGGRIRGRRGSSRREGQAGEELVLEDEGDGASLNIGAHAEQCLGACSKAAKTPVDRPASIRKPKVHSLERGSFTSYDTVSRSALVPPP